MCAKIKQFNSFVCSSSQGTVKVCLTCSFANAESVCGTGQKAKILNFSNFVIYSFATSYVKPFFRSSPKDFTQQATVYVCVNVSVFFPIFLLLKTLFIFNLNFFGFDYLY